MLVYAATQAFHSFPETGVIGFHRHTTTLLEGWEQLVECPYLCYQHLEGPCKEEGTAFLGEHRNVFRREREALTCGVMFQVASAGHLAEPLAGVPFIDLRALRQFRTRCRRLRQGFEEAEAVPDARHHDRIRAGGICHHFAHESLDLGLIDTLLCRHVFSPILCCWSCLIVSSSPVANCS